MTDTFHLDQSKKVFYLQPEVNIVKLKDNAIIPYQANEDDAGFDLHATEGAKLIPTSRALIGTGIAIELPPNLAAFITPRSGLALNKGITVLNTPGLIDPGYRGEIGVILYNSNLTGSPFYVSEGDRIAQLVFVEVVTPSEFLVKKEISKTERGSGGFGSTRI